MTSPSNSKRLSIAEGRQGQATTGPAPAGRGASRMERKDGLTAGRADRSLGVRPIGQPARSSLATRPISSALFDEGGKDLRSEAINPKCQKKKNDFTGVDNRDPHRSR